LAGFNPPTTGRF